MTFQVRILLLDANVGQSCLQPCLPLTHMRWDEDKVSMEKRLQKLQVGEEPPTGRDLHWCKPWRILVKRLRMICESPSTMILWNPKDEATWMPLMRAQSSATLLVSAPKLPTETKIR
jgi:hypothetical protein